jgi:hypothetical protein
MQRSGAPPSRSRRSYVILFNMEYEVTLLTWFYLVGQIGQRSTCRTTLSAKHRIQHSLTDDLHRHGASLTRSANHLHRRIPANSTERTLCPGVKAQLFLAPFSLCVSRQVRLGLCKLSLDLDGNTAQPRSAFASVELPPLLKRETTEGSATDTSRNGLWQHLPIRRHGTSFLGYGNPIQEKMEKLPSLLHGHRANLEISRVLGLGSATTKMLRRGSGTRG